ncbi:hypothetical protein BHM03_00020508 [Ensete ventricosum]|nr:hypothetical protein BHM03_00020508 [Ensete ventricosum]
MLSRSRSVARELLNASQGESLAITGRRKRRATHELLAEASRGEGTRRPIKSNPLSAKNKLGSPDVDRNHIKVARRHVPTETAAGPGRTGSCLTPEVRKSTLSRTLRVSMMLEINTYCDVG